VAYPFLYEVPFITLATPGMDPRHSAVLGNVLNPAYVSNPLYDFPKPMSMWHRLCNTLILIGMVLYWRNWAIVPLIQKEISPQFPELPSLLDLERNMSLALLNTHFAIDTPLPLLPSQVEVGAMHCRPGNSLPQELESWITGAGSAGVIYFSLGSFTRGTSMPTQYLDLFIQAFRKLPQRVIWKYEGELQDISNNVMISKWLPQQDILAHDNVKVFITHCGLLSLQESIYHATPLLALPIFGDQPKNGMFVKNSGLGDSLVWEELTVDMIVDTLTKITSDPKYIIICLYTICCLYSTCWLYCISSIYSRVGGFPFLLRLTVRVRFKVASLFSTCCGSDLNRVIRLSSIERREVHNEVIRLT
ncbi:hypothetical protein OTU49_011229, partial [Cherax quadricarinatus]